MNYILISFIIIMLWWLIFGGRYTIYILLLLAPAIFFAYGQYLYGTVTGFLMYYLTLVRLEQTKNNVAHSKIYKKLIVGLIFASVPLLARFTPFLTVPEMNNDPIILAVVTSIIIVFVTASIALTAGMKRIKGDKEVHE